MCAVSVRTSEKKTRIVNVHQQLTCGEQRCTTVIVDGNTRATVATEQGRRPATLTSGGEGEHAEPVEKMPRQETEMPTVQS